MATHLQLEDPPTRSHCLVLARQTKTYNLVRLCNGYTASEIYLLQRKRLVLGFHHPQQLQSTVG
jgi:hypothetical protein